MRSTPEPVLDNSAAIVAVTVDGGVPLLIAEHVPTIRIADCAVRGHFDNHGTVTMEPRQVSTLIALMHPGAGAASMGEGRLPGGPAIVRGGRCVMNRYG